MQLVDKQDDLTCRALDFFNGEAWETLVDETLEYDDLGYMTRAAQAAMTDDGLENSLMFTYHWRDVSVGVEDDETPDQYVLDAAYPNPFNPATTIQYRLTAAGPLSIQVYDLLGRQVATLFDGNQVSGTHEVHFDAQGLSSGIYLVRLEAPGFSQTRSVTLLK